MTFYIEFHLTIKLRNKLSFIYWVYFVLFITFYLLTYHYYCAIKTIDKFNILFLWKYKNMELIGLRSPHHFACVLDDECVSLCTYTLFPFDICVLVTNVQCIIHIRTCIYTGVQKYLDKQIHSALLLKNLESKKFHFILLFKHIFFKSKHNTVVFNKYYLLLHAYCMHNM